MPAGLFLGGAPFNVAHDLHRLGYKAEIASRIGEDVLGNEIVRRLRREGMSTALIQTDHELPTGFVEVSFDDKGNPDFHIVEPVAWDSIETDRNMVQAVELSGMLVFGTLACRNQVTRKTVRELAEVSQINVLDVNLRPGATSKWIVEDLLKRADIVKANASELGVLRDWFGLPAGDREAVEELARRFSCSTVAISSGHRGGNLWRDGRWTHHGGFKVHTVNSVGAGDAFLAGLLSSISEGKSDEEMLERANRLGAYVVTRWEATPDFSARDIDSIR